MESIRTQRGSVVSDGSLVFTIRSIILSGAISFTSLFNCRDTLYSRFCVTLRRIPQLGFNAHRVLLYFSGFNHSRLSCHWRWNVTVVLNLFSGIIFHDFTLNIPRLFVRPKLLFKGADGNWYPHKMARNKKKDKKTVGSMYYALGTETITISNSRTKRIFVAFLTADKILAVKNFEKSIATPEGHWDG